MTRMDDILQNRLAALESGLPLEQVLAGLPRDAASLAPAIRLAAAARQLPTPRLDPAAASRQQGLVQAAAYARRSHRPARPAWLGSPSRRPLAFAGGALLVLLVLGAALLILNGPVAAQSARLANVSGMVEVASTAGDGAWHFVQGPESIRQGQRVRTYSGSSVELVFYEGSRSVIGPDSDITLSALGGGWAGALQVELAQNLGATANDVVPLTGPGSFFRVNTPAGGASVHGTSFNVELTEAGEALFAVTHGKVAVTGAASQVVLVSGQATAVLPGEDPQAPGYQFSLRGAISDLQAASWTVAGTTFGVGPDTEILGAFKPGDLVFVQGRILADGSWMADRIQPAASETVRAHFTGAIEAMPAIPSAWTIGGKSVLVNKETELDSGLKVGSPVQVSYVVQADGTWLAKSIEMLEEEGQRPTATPASTATQTVTATLTGTPAGGTATVTPTVTGTPGTPTPSGTPGTATPTVTATATVMPKNDTARCDNRTQQQPEGLRLAARYKVTYEEIMTWFCKGFGFGEIDLAYSLSLSTGVPVAQIFTLRSAGQSWGQIKKDLTPQMTPMPTATSGGNGNGNGNGPKKTPNPRKP